MQKITSSIELRAAIVALEAKQRLDGAALKVEFLAAYEKIQPINIIKNTVKEAFNSHDLKADLIDASVGMAMGYVSKTLFEGETHSPIRKLLGTALMFGVSNLVTNNPDFVKNLGEKFINLFRSTSSSDSNEVEKEPLPSNPSE